MQDLYRSSFCSKIWPSQKKLIRSLHKYEADDGKFMWTQIKAIGQTELNSSNPEEVLQLAAQKRKKKFLQAMAKLYF